MEPILFRILVSSCAGFIIGIERQLHRQPAGLKTHILICVGSTLLMILSLVLSGVLILPSFLFTSITSSSFVSTAFVGDPARLAAQVISGIGFLGGGAIIRQGFNIKGLTTAATIWVTSAIGLAIGLGQYYPALLTLVSVMLTLIIIERFETLFFPAKNIQTIYFLYQEDTFRYDNFLLELKKLKIIINSMDVSKTLSSNKIKLIGHVHVPQTIDYFHITESAKKAGTLLKISINSNEHTN